MSDTADRDDPPRRRGCCGKLAVLALLLGGGFAGYVGWALHASKADAPLPFTPFAYRPLEESLLTAKFEFLELGGRVLGTSTDVELNQREVNLLLFGKAGHTTEQKAQVVLDGDLMRIEASRPRDGGGFLNLVATLRPSLGPTTTTVEVVDARLGGYQADPLTRALLQRWLERELTRTRADDARLDRVKALWVEKGKVRLVYDPAK